MISRRVRSAESAIMSASMEKPSQTPAALGYRMPAEWEPHAATWLSWPHREGISFPGSYDSVMPVFVQMVHALSGSEKVCINVGDYDQEEEVRFLLREGNTSHVEF